MQKLAEVDMGGLWAEWADKFFKAQRGAPAPEIATVLLGALLAEIGHDTTFPPPEILQTFPYQMGQTRAEAIGLNITPIALTFVSCILSNSPGTVVMYLYALRRWQVLHGGLLVNMDAICSIFPFGFPTKEALAEVWDAQKCYTMGIEGDNFLDAIPMDVLKA